VNFNVQIRLKPHQKLNQASDDLTWCHDVSFLHKVNCSGALNTETSFPLFLSKPRYKTKYYGMLKRLFCALIGHRFLLKSYYPNLVKATIFGKRTFFDPVGAKFISQRAQTFLIAFRSSSIICLKQLSIGG